jgi:hypothetical protein
MIAQRAEVDPHLNFYRSLPPEEEQLLILRDFLYEGDWAEMLQDLRARQSGKPFIFKLKTRIDEDLRRIERLRQYEREHAVNLGQYLRREELEGDAGRLRERRGT